MVEAVPGRGGIHPHAADRIGVLDGCRRCRIHGLTMRAKPVVFVPVFPCKPHTTDLPEPKRERGDTGLQPRRRCPEAVCRA
jgi:hypothetical protein